MRFILLFFICTSFTTLSAQTITLSARVEDKTTGEPLPFASIGIKGKALGTVTNLQGEFDFHFPNNLRNEILVISMLGYRNFEAPVWSLLEMTKVIQMEKSTTVLREVVVKDSLSGSEILKIAIARIEQNFPMKPFLLDGFYRDLKKVGGVYIALLEAAVKVYDQNYLEPRNKFKLRERVKLIEVRKSVGYDNKFTSYFDQRNLLEELLLHNNIRYRQLELTNDLLLHTTRQPDSYYNEDEVFVVHYDRDFSFTMFISKKDYAIVHVDYESAVTADQLARRRGMVSKGISFKKSLDFKRFEDKMYLNYITVTTKENWEHERKADVRFQTELIQSFLVNNIYTKAPQEITTSEKMKNYGLQYQDYPYNKDFWENYNVLKETPLDKKILDDLEHMLPLEAQFQAY